VSTRDDPGPVRDDMAPLTRRFTALGDPVAARWKSGTLGDPDMPGPSSYWIDAVVQVSPAVAERLGDNTDDADPPEVVDDLAPELPDGPWVGSEQLDRALSTSGFSADVRLDPGTDTVVVRAVGAG
jgi:hypothetical protein